MNPPLSSYLLLVRDIRSVADAIAAPKIAVGWLTAEFARFVFDHTGWFGREIETEALTRYHFRRAAALGASVYCVYHACDSKDCPPGEHADD